MMGRGIVQQLWSATVSRSGGQVAKLTEENRSPRKICQRINAVHFGLKLLRERSPLLFQLSNARISLSNFLSERLQNLVALSLQIAAIDPVFTALVVQFDRWNAAGSLLLSLLLPLLMQHRHLLKLTLKLSGEAIEFWSRGKLLKLKNFLAQRGQCSQRFSFLQGN